MFRLPPAPVWIGLVGSTTSVWFLLHAFLVGVPYFTGMGRPTLVLLPVSVILVAAAAAVSILDLHGHRERILFANLGLGLGSVYAAAVLWLSGLEILLSILVALLTRGAAS